MPKKIRVRTLMDGQHVKGTERLLKYARQYFFDNCWLLWKKIGSKSSNLVVSENLSLFVNILRSDEKHSLSIKASEVFFIFTQTYIKIEILLRKRLASEVISFWNYRLKKEELINAQKALCQDTYEQSTC